MKNIGIISMLVLLPLLTSCGFKKTNQKNSDIIHLQNITVTGEERVGYSLKNNIFLISSINSGNKYDLEIEIIIKKIDKIKDRTGKVTRYNLEISAYLQLINIDNKKNLQRTFIRNGNYIVASNHTDTINNEKQATKNITKQLSDDIISFISLSMINR
tara:strand:+ start:941 stop:1414 length:474 start_codon:yes stop_codon:yes gene_type:complete